MSDSRARPAGRHPWNTSFAWQHHAGDCTTITAEQAAQFDALGYFVFENAFDAATLERLDACLDRAIDR
jgi:hypothetical protein